MHSSYRWQTVLSFASPIVRCELSERDKQRLMTLAIFAGMAVQDLIDVHDTAVALTAREKEVLLWVAGGKSAWETSQILGISERTVKKHQDIARQKFGVGTTIQAVVQAIRRHYIRP
jgi:LuxR family quorum sensing-dependent transcriptional regulator